MNRWLLALPLVLVAGFACGGRVEGGPDAVTNGPPGRTAGSVSSASISAQAVPLGLYDGCVARGGGSGGQDTYGAPSMRVTKAAGTLTATVIPGEGRGLAFGSGQVTFSPVTPTTAIAIGGPALALLALDDDASAPMTTFTSGSLAFVDQTIFVSLHGGEPSEWSTVSIACNEPPTGGSPSGVVATTASTADVAGSYACRSDTLIATNGGGGYVGANVPLVLTTTSAGVAATFDGGQVMAGDLDFGVASEGRAYVLLPGAGVTVSANGCTGPDSVAEVPFTAASGTLVVDSGDVFITLEGAAGCQPTVTFQLACARGA